jgi:hypothetical protein
VLGPAGSKLITARSAECCTTTPNICPSTASVRLHRLTVGEASIYVLDTHLTISEREVFQRKTFEQIFDSAALARSWRHDLAPNDGFPSSKREHLAAYRRRSRLRQPHSSQEELATTTAERGQGVRPVGIQRHR